MIKLTKTLLVMTVITGLGIVVGINQPLVTAQTPNDSCPGTSKLTKAEIDDILKVHNQARAEVGVPPLKWNCNIASFAQSYINKGVWKHNPDTTYGENLAALGDMKAPVGLDGSKMWYEEKANWNNKTRECATGQVCGHYTQMVWKGSTEIGCGVNRNATADWGEAVFLVCNYNPAGNMYGENGMEAPY